MTSQSKPIEDALPALKDLFESLQRAGDHWDLGTSLSTDATPRGYEALLPLKARLPRGAALPLSQYIRGFLRARGWACLVYVFPGYVRLILSSA